MTETKNEHMSLISLPLFPFDLPDEDTAPTMWTFDTPPMSASDLSFHPRPSPFQPKKRRRTSGDVEGEHSCVQKKKRRLRLFLITSRLSPQFSHPATNCVDRGSSKIAVWAKQRALGKNLLRKAAILNSLRRGAGVSRGMGAGQGRSLVEQEKEQEELKLARLEFNQGSIDTYTHPILAPISAKPQAAAVRSEGHVVSMSPSTRRSPPPISPPLPLEGDDRTEYRSPNEAYAYSPPRALGSRKDYVPLPRSPLGLSNYDAFDDEDDLVPNPFSDSDEEDMEANTIFPSHSACVKLFMPFKPHKTLARDSQSPMTEDHAEQDNDHTCHAPTRHPRLYPMAATMPSPPVHATHMNPTAPPRSPPRPTKPSSAPPPPLFAPAASTASTTSTSAFNPTSALRALLATSCAQSASGQTDWRADAYARTGAGAAEWRGRHGEE